MLDLSTRINYQDVMSPPFAQQTATQQAAGALLPIDEPASVLAILLAVLGGIFWIAQHPALGRTFKIVPSLVFCYFVPTALTTAGVIPAKSALYEWIKDMLLPASLLLLVLALDVPAILRLGWKAVVMMLAGTVGVIVGGPITLAICQAVLPARFWPEDAWQGMAALSGSWIGGGVNFVAMGHVAGTSDAMLATMVIPDVFVASIWMGMLLYLSGHQHTIDEWTGANAQAIRDLERRMTDFQEHSARIATVPDLIIILAIGFVGSRLSSALGEVLPEIATARSGTLIAHDAWTYIIVTTVGVVLSFTRLRNLEGVGASKLGTVMLYLLVACIGASADFRKILDSPGLILMGFIWIALHGLVMLIVGRLIRAPIFYFAVGSQANIGGAASAPVVAAAFHPALAPVGALLAIAGYVMGTYGGIICMKLLMAVAGVSGAR